MAGSFMNSSLPAHKDVSLVEIARRVGTPLYVYRASDVTERYLAFDQAFGGYPHRVHYALKANSTLAIARLVQTLGGGADANSGGEIDVALRSGFRPSDIVFTGVGKSIAELEQAVALDLHSINAESLGELERIHELARIRGTQTRVALRVNPDVAAGSHPHISTGQSTHKFGVPVGSAAEICRRVMTLDGLKLVGLHVHIGSQLVAGEPIRDAVSSVVALARNLGAQCPLEHIDVGGGLGISYDGSDTLSVSEYAQTIVDTIRPTGLSILLEPGRWIVGPAGVLVASVVDVKRQNDDRYFVVLDAGMSEFLRPALYGAVHRLEPLEQRSGGSVLCDLVGPICETSDVLGMARLMPLPEVGDLIAVLDVGAYGSTMASNYNRHPLPAEVLVDGLTWSVIRRRQTYDDMVSLEV